MASPRGLRRFHGGRGGQVLGGDRGLQGVEPSPDTCWAPLRRTHLVRRRQNASNVLPNPPDYTKLLAQVRKVKVSDQRQLCKWLSDKFASEDRR